MCDAIVTVLHSLSINVRRDCVSFAQPVAVGWVTCYPRVIFGRNEMVRNELRTRRVVRRVGNSLPTRFPLAGTNGA